MLTNEIKALSQVASYCNSVIDKEKVAILHAFGFLNAFKLQVAKTWEVEELIKLINSTYDELLTYTYKTLEKQIILQRYSSYIDIEVIDDQAFYSLNSLVEYFDTKSNSDPLGASIELSHLMQFAFYEDLSLKIVLVDFLQQLETQNLLEKFKQSIDILGLQESGIYSDFSNINNIANKPFTYGLAGNDRLYGTSGSDVLDGGVGDDDLYGENGGDILFGSGGSDFLYGGNVCDTLIGGYGTDKLKGDNGNDIYIFDLGSGQDYIYDGSGANSIIFNYAIEVTDLRLSIFNHYNLKLESLHNPQDFIIIENGALYSFFRNFDISVNNQKYTFANFDLYGTNSNDDIQAFYSNLTAYGLAGNDRLYGTSGALMFLTVELVMMY